MRFGLRLNSLAVALVVTGAAASSIGAAPAPSGRAETCLLGIIGCSQDGPTSTAGATPPPAQAPAPASTPSPSAPAEPGQSSSADPLPAVPASPLVGGTDSGTVAPPPVLAPNDSAAMPLTNSPAKLSGSTLSITGLKSLGVVTVTLPGGETARHIKLEADHIVIDGFGLDVTGSDGHGVLTTATAMTADGTAVVYLDSITGLLATGATAAFDALAPPLSVDDLLGLTKLTLDLYGLSADTLSLSNSHEALH